jgi:methylenetetrahydrofolate--tRNA-(uracil-5-)-methyltransferase
VGITVVGGGLAGSECAYQLAERGADVTLIEQKPLTRSAAHHLDGLAELVCSNSLRAADMHNAVGLIKEEMRRCGSLIMACADKTAVPAGGALAVDRELFSAEVGKRIDAHPRIQRVARVVEAIPSERPVVIATGPMTGELLTQDLARAIGSQHLAYYDSIAPIVIAESIDWGQVFSASRYDKGGDDAYVNCPLDKAQYEAFVAALVAAEKTELNACETPRYFEGCLPIEVMAERGPRTLAFGPMKPVGLTDPRTGRWPHAVVQLRREDQEGTAYNMVGFQTRMTHAAQRATFALIPGLQNARFERFGSVHRNTFVNAPAVLDETLQLRAMPGVFLAGQITGVEGYVESAACGLCVGVMLAERAHGRQCAPPAETTALGALLSHLRKPADDFQPSNVVFSMFPSLPTVASADAATQSAPRKPKKQPRKERREQLVKRALDDLPSFAGYR